MSNEILVRGTGNPNTRNYGLIAEIYQQLKKNYDDRMDYWAAGDFHYGEMEMKRLSSSHRNATLRWLHRNLGLIAWYKYASEYGESYLLPVLWLVLVLAAFTLLYPVTGLRYDASRNPSGVATLTQPKLQISPTTSLTYAQPFHAGSEESNRKWRARLSLVGNSLMTTLYVAAFQKDLAYEPSYPWGRALALAEVLLTSTLVALFLLAVRRQFRR